VAPSLTSYIIAQMDDSGHISGEWQLGLADLELAVGLDADKDGQLTWGEVKSCQPDIATYLAENIAISRAGQPCNLRFAAMDRLQDHGNEAFAVTDFSAQCALSGSLQLEYNAIFSFDSSHEVVLNISDKEHRQSYVLDDNSRLINIDLRQGS
jgi:hypothetical protein